MSPRNHILDRGPDPLWEGQFWGGKGDPTVKCRDTTVICAKTAELIKMPFGFLAWTAQGIKY